MNNSYKMYSSACLLLAAVVFSASSMAQPSTEEEASMGAAALIVLASKCDAPKVSFYQDEARKTLNYMIQRFSSEQQSRIFENLDTKIKALQMSSSADSCSSSVRLKSMASNWGYQHLVKTLQSNVH